MDYVDKKTNWVMFSLGFIGCLLLRLIPFRIPNVVSIMAVQMPFSKVYGGLVGFLFGVLSIVSYDLLTGTIGIWTLVTATTYGLVGFFAGKFFQKRTMSSKNVAAFAVVGTLFYDAFTGLTVGPIIFHQSFMGALVGQIPFTILHLIGNVSFSLLLSPIMAKYLVHKRHPRLSNERTPLLAIIMHKLI